jgi:hypothetical protein
MNREERQAALKQAYGMLYMEASRLVREADPIRLIAIGAPDDEYDVEIGAILPRLREARSAAVAGCDGEGERLAPVEDLVPRPSVFIRVRLRFRPETDRPAR